jgi:transcription antitermination factor NusG
LNEESLHWFALKVFYNKVLAIASALKEMSIESYYPIKVVEKEHNGIKRLEKIPAVCSLLFFRSTISQATDIQKLFENRVILYKYRSSKAPAIIPDGEMKVFQLVTSANSDGLEYMDADAVNFKAGQHVHVTGGVFEGADGYIKRIRGSKRLIVAIEGIVAVATTYIPSCFLEIIDNEP